MDEQDFEGTLVLEQLAASTRSAWPNLELIAAGLAAYQSLTRRSGSRATVTGKGVFHLSRNVVIVSGDSSVMAMIDRPCHSLR